MADTNTNTLIDALIAAANMICIAAICWPLATLDLTESGDSNTLRPRELLPCVMDQDGYFHGQLFGGIERELTWQGDAMLCDGMNRPDGQGYRLVFHEQVTPDLPGLMFVIGLADAELGVTGKEIQANVTIIDQVNGTFFSTQEQPRCWSTLTDQQLLRGTVEETWRINGELYCAGALAALMGPGSVTLADVRFSGIVKPETETTN